jgi:hypothetical protein
MGSMIHLTPGHLYIDYGKIRGYLDHGALFQRGDEAIGPYKYVGDNNERIIEEKQCFCRPLHRIKPRLEMLGYTLEACRSWTEKWLHDVEEALPKPSFSAFTHALRSLPLVVDGPYVAFEEAVRAAYAKAPGSGYTDGESASYIAFERILDPYVVLRVLAEFPEMYDLPVRWKFADVVENGWVSPEEIVPGCAGATCMIVTEGSSDVHILERSLVHLFPDIADFFDFIDMKAGNPFPGVGNLVTFCKGLSRIGYDGRMLVVLDNDTAGRGAFEAIRSSNVAPSVKVTTLPSLPEFRRFKTLGPAGEAVEDINGRACAIECFLDLTVLDAEPTVRWTSYDRKLASYQGELVRKDDYTRAFGERFGRDDTYDTRKLRALWAHLIAESTMSRLTFHQEDW